MPIDGEPSHNSATPPVPVAGMTCAGIVLPWNQTELRPLWPQGRLQWQEHLMQKTKLIPTCQRLHYKIRPSRQVNPPRPRRYKTILRCAGRIRLLQVTSGMHGQVLLKPNNRIIRAFAAEVYRCFLGNPDEASIDASLFAAHSCESNGQALLPLMLHSLWNGSRIFCAHFFP